MDIVIETDRLLLAKPEVADFQPLFDLVSDPETCRYLGPPPTIPDMHMRFQRGAGSWSLYGYGSLMGHLKNTGELVGTFGIFHSWRGLGDDFDDQPEAGWITKRQHVGTGISGEAMRASLAWFDREHGPRRVVAMIDPGNAPSLGLAAALGFARYRETRFPPGDGEQGEAVILLERAPG
ncbi:GNAT family N-acetyltransferase [Altererythrobacter aquiaggeris]|uniref:GNAT family N-acetyltransferase n=1 Tax=Aestuarierythrobacter aquiaggeris TaxID=1898396 RepID=UPI003017B517